MEGVGTDANWDMQIRAAIKVKVAQLLVAPPEETITLVVRTLLALQRDEELINNNTLMTGRHIFALRRSIVVLVLWNVILTFILVVMGVILWLK